MISLVTFLIVLGIMILVHEIGHFMMAKYVNVKVLTFSLGMGPQIIARQWGDTKYRLAAIPMGGYIKMLGEMPGDTDEVIDPSDLGRSYWAQTPIKRAAITAAGPFLNLILALLIAPLSYMIGIEAPSYPFEPPVVQGLTPGSPADIAGFQYGDRIIEVDGKTFETWEKLEEHFYMNPGATQNVKFKRGDQTLDTKLTLIPHEKFGLGISGFDMYETTIIGAFSEGSPALKAGLKEKDRILEIAGKPIKSFSQLRDTIQASSPGNFNVKVARAIAGSENNEEIVTVEVTPKLLEDGQEKRYIIGVGPYVPMTLVKYGPIRAFKEGSVFLWDKAVGNMQALGKLFTLKLGFKTMSGPVGIGFVIASARKAGFSHLLQMVALISMMLGIINFFPFPGLDGGHIMMAFVEFVSRRKLNRKVVDILNTGGMLLLFSLIFLVSIQDVARFKDEILRFFGIG